MFETDEVGSGCRCTRHDNEWILVVFKQTESHRNERDHGDRACMRVHY